MTFVVECDCYCFFAAHYVFLPHLLITNSVAPPLSRWERVFFGAIFTSCMQKLTEEKNTKTNCERKRRKEGGQDDDTICSPETRILDFSVRWTKPLPAPPIFPLAIFIRAFFTCTRRCHDWYCSFPLFLPTQGSLVISVPQFLNNDSLWII